MERDEHRLRCTARTDGGPEKDDTDADVYVYPVDADYNPLAGVMRGGNRMTPERTGGVFEEGDAHSGRFAARFEVHVHHHTRPLIVLTIPPVGGAMQLDCLPRTPSFCI